MLLVVGDARLSASLHVLLGLEDENREPDVHFDQNRGHQVSAEEDPAPVVMTLNKSSFKKFRHDQTGMRQTRHTNKMRGTENFVGGRTYHRI